MAQTAMEMDATYSLCSILGCCIPSMLHTRAEKAQALLQTLETTYSVIITNLLALLT